MEKIVYSIFLSALLVGCGGGNNASNDHENTNKAVSKQGSSTPVERAVAKKNKEEKVAYARYRIKIDNDPTIEKKSYKGTLFNGYVESSRICLDLNKNNFCDYNEPLSVSDSKGEFELKVPLTKVVKTKLQNEPVMILASRGTDINTNRKYMAFLKTPTPSQASASNVIRLSPLETLMVTQLKDINDKDEFKRQLSQKQNELKTIFGNDLGLYKANLKFQKTAQLLSSSLQNENEIQSLESLRKIYSNFVTNSNDFDTFVDTIANQEAKNVTEVAKKVANWVEQIDLSNQAKRESISILVDGKINEAQVHFRNSKGEFSTSDIDVNNVQDEAIRLRIREIGLSNVTQEMIDAVKSNNIALSDLDNVEKIENIEALKPLSELLKKKANAKSELFILKSLISSDFTKLNIYFSHPLNKESQKKLADTDEVKKIYTITGLSYGSIIKSEYDENENVNTLTFDSKVTINSSAQIVINELMIADSKDIYSRPSPTPTYIETPRYLPKTGQKYVFTAYDDGSLSYGADLEYKKTAAGLSSDIANLQWEDISFTSGTNDVITYSQAKSYCEGATTYGYNDWRLPNVKEAVSATSLDSGVSFFSSYPVSQIIHVNTQNTSLDRTMGVGADGQVANLIPVKDDFWGRVDGKYGVRCVRDINSGSMYPHKAHDNIIMHEKDKTSYDPSLRLMFEDTPYTKEENDALVSGKNIGKMGDLSHAISHCKGLNDAKFGGFANWRLPNANELFYSLDGKGNETYQNQIPSYGYYMTSSSSYVGGVAMSWFTGNFYVRKYLDSRTNGYIRCVRDMDEAQLKEAKNEPKAPANTNVKRRYKVDENKSVTLTVPAEIFSQYTGIRLTQTPDENLTNIAYEITNMLDPNEPFPHFTIVSLTKNGKAVDPQEDGYFDFWVDRYLVGNNYGKRAFKTGDKIKLVVNNRLYDVTINLNIGENTNEVNENSQTPTEVTAKEPTLQAPSAGVIDISASSGYRIDNPSRNVLYFASFGLTERAQYNIVKNEGSPKIKSFSIVSGNDDDVFEFVQNITNKQFELRVKEDKMSSLTPKLYTLHVKANNGKDSNEVEIKVKVVEIKAPELEQNLVLDLKNAQAESSWAGKTTDGRLVLFKIVFFNPSPYSKYETKLIAKENGFSDNQVSYSGNSENYEVVAYDDSGSKAYGIVVKDGKKRANESIKVKVTAVAKNGEKVYSEATLQINGAGASEEVVHALKPEFVKNEIEREVTDAASNNQQLGGDIIDMKTYSKDTTLTIAPAGIFKLGAMKGDTKPQFYLHVVDKSKLTKAVFNEQGDTKTFTITATNAKGSSELKVKVKLIIAEQPQLQALKNPINLYPVSGQRDDGSDAVIAISLESVKDDKYNIVKALGLPILKDLIIVSGNEEGIFEYKNNAYFKDLTIKVKSDKVKDLVEGKTYTLKLKGTNGDLETNTIDVDIKVLEQIAPSLKSDVSVSLAKKQVPSQWGGDKTEDGKTILFKLAKSSWSEWYVYLIEAENGFKEDQISYELATVSSNYEIVKYEKYGSKYYGIVKKEGGAEVAEDLSVKVIGTYGDNKIKSAITTLKITN